MCAVCVRIICQMPLAGVCELQPLHLRVLASVNPEEGIGLGFAAIRHWNHADVILASNTCSDNWAFHESPSWRMAAYEIQLQFSHLPGLNKSAGLRCYCDGARTSSVYNPDAALRIATVCHLCLIVRDRLKC